MYFKIFIESSFKGIYAAIKESYKDYCTARQCWLIGPILV